MRSTKTIGAVRTATPGLWAAFLVWACSLLLRRPPDATELALLLGAAPLVSVVIYRAVRELDAYWPWVGRVFLGSAKSPAVFTSPEVAAQIDADDETRSDVARFAAAAARGVDG